MSRTQALEILAAPDKDAAAKPKVIGDALRVVGAHLARQVELPAGAVAVAIGRSNLDLLAGARQVYGEQRTYTVVARRARRWSQVETQWITGEPPRDVPLVMFSRTIVSGATVRAVLADLGRVDEQPIIVLAVSATTKGIEAILETHPTVTVTAADPEGANR